MTFLGCLGCGPGARSFCAKSIGRAGPLPGGFDRLPKDAAGPVPCWCRAGRSGDRTSASSAEPPVAPTRREHLHRGFGWLARPVQDAEGASWFLRRRSLPPGLAPGRRPTLAGISLCSEGKEGYFVSHFLIRGISSEDHWGERRLLRNAEKS